MLSGELLQTCGVDHPNLLPSELHRTGVLDASSLPAKNLVPSIIQMAVLLTIVVNIASVIGRVFGMGRKDRA